MATAERFPGAEFGEIVGAGGTLAQASPAQPQRAERQGLKFLSVEYDPGPARWAVDYQAGERLYRYRATPQGHSLAVCDGAQFATIARDEATAGAVESVLEMMAGLGWRFDQFRLAYEMWFVGYVSGWCAAESAGREGIAF